MSKEYLLGVSTPDGAGGVTTANLANAAVTAAKTDVTGSMGTFTFTADKLEVGTPTNPNAVPNKAYVDAVASGVSDPKDSCRVATVAALPVTPTLNTLTATAFGNINVAGIDGVTTLVVGDRVLVKNEGSSQYNGIYEITVLGDGLTAYVLVRTSDANTSPKVTSGMFTFITEGTTNASTGWLLTTQNPITLNTTPLSFTQFTGVGTINAGAGLTKTGNTLDVVANVDGSIVVNPNDVQVGILATDAQHGVRGGGSQHANATTSVAGFMSAADKVTVDNVSAGFTNELYVNTLASATGATGSVARPFKTITAALAAITQSGTLLMVAAGTYNENIIWPTAYDNIGIRGAGSGLTTIDGTSGSADTVSFVPGSGSFKRFTLAGVHLKNTTNTKRCLVLDGDGTLSGGFANFLTDLGLLDDVTMDKGSSTGDAFYSRSVSQMLVRAPGGFSGTDTNFAGWYGSVTLLNPGLLTFQAMTVGILGGTSLTYTYDNANVKPLNGRQGVYLTASSKVNGNTIVGKTPLFGVDSSSALSGTLTDSGLTTYGSGPLHAPIIAIAGTVGTGAALTSACVTLALPATAAGRVPNIFFAGATFFGLVSVSSLGAGIGRNYVNCQNAKFYGAAAGAVTAGADTDIDIRGALYNQALLSDTAGVGAIDRDFHTITGIGIVVASTSVTISPRFPPGTGNTGGTPYATLLGYVPNYVVGWETKVATATAVGITAKAAASFTQVATVAISGANTTWTITRGRL